MISTTHLPLDSRIFYKEAKSLKKAGYEVTVIGNMNPKIREKIDDITIIGIDKKVDIRSYHSLIRELFNEAINVDAEIYHFHEPESIFIAIYLKIFKNKIIVYDIHEYYRDILPSMSIQRKFFFTFVLYFIEPLFCRYFDAIITVDEGIAKIYRKFSKCVYPIPNFPSIDVFGSNNIIEKYEDYDVVMYVGGMSEERGIFSLIKSIHKISKMRPLVKLLLVGDFHTEGFKSRCIEYINLIV